MARVASIAKSFVNLLSFSTHVILTLLRISDFSCAAMTEEEVAAGLEQGRQVGLMGGMNIRRHKGISFRRYFFDVFDAFCADMYCLEGEMAMPRVLRACSWLLPG